MSKAMVITPEEAMLIDWVLTMHSYDPFLLEKLQEADMVALRKKIAPIVVGTREEQVELTDKDFQYLLVTIPITFRFYQEDIGFSLKKKLLTLLSPPKISWVMKEEKDESSDNKDNPSEDNPQDFPKDLS